MVAKASSAGLPECLDVLVCQCGFRLNLGKMSIFIKVRGNNGKKRIFADEKRNLIY